MTTQMLHLPQILFDYWRPKKVAEQKITEASVLKLVRKKRISFSRGAELLDMPLQDFFDLAAEHKIPYLDYEKGELKREVEALKKAFQKINAETK